MNIELKELQCQFLNWSSTVYKNCRYNCPQLPFDHNVDKVRLYSICVTSKYCTNSVIEDCRNYQSKQYDLPALCTPSMNLIHQHYPNLRCCSHFDYTFSVGKVVRIKIFLKYGIRIRFVSCCNCILVTTFGNFDNCLTFFKIFFIFSVVTSHPCL